MLVCSVWRLRLIAPILLPRHLAVNMVNAGHFSRCGIVSCGLQRFLLFLFRMSSRASAGSSSDVPPSDLFGF